MKLYERINSYLNHLFKNYYLFWILNEEESLEKLKERQNDKKSDKDNYLEEVIKSYFV